MKRQTVNLVIWKIWMEFQGALEDTFEEVGWIQTREGFKGQERYFRGRIMMFPSWDSKSPLCT